MPSEQRKCARSDLQTDCLGVVQGDMPLHAAAQHAGPAVIKLMLENGCNPVAENLLVSHTAPAHVWDTYAFRQSNEPELLGCKLHW